MNDSIIEWEKGANRGRVLSQRGSFWSSLGSYDARKYYLNPEELLWIKLKHGCTILLDDEHCSLDVFEVICASSVPAAFLNVYLELKDIGYVVWRNDSRYLKSSFDCSSLFFVIFKPRHNFSRLSALQESCLSLKYIDHDCDAMPTLRALAAPSLFFCLCLSVQYLLLQPEDGISLVE